MIDPTLGDLGLNAGQASIPIHQLQTLITFLCVFNEGRTYLGEGEWAVHEDECLEQGEPCFHPDGLLRLKRLSGCKTGTFGTLLLT